jgi:protein phosphatase 1 regulatory subunit 7
VLQDTLHDALFTSVSQMNGNQIPDLQSLESELGSIKTLETIYLEANPCQKNDMTGYRRKIMLALPHLKQIDAT